MDTSLTAVKPPETDAERTRRLSDALMAIAVGEHSCAHDAEIAIQALGWEPALQAAVIAGAQEWSESEKRLADGNR